MQVERWQLLVTRRSSPRVVVGRISPADSEIVIVAKSLTLTRIAAGTAIARMGIARNTEGHLMIYFRPSSM